MRHCVISAAGVRADGMEATTASWHAARAVDGTPSTLELSVVSGKWLTRTRTGGAG